MTLLMIGTTELLVVAGLALLLFGGKKLPELMKGMGQGVKNFKEGLQPNNLKNNKKRSRHQRKYVTNLIAP